MSHIQVGGRKGRVALLLVAVAAAAHFWVTAPIPTTPDNAHPRHPNGGRSVYEWAHAGPRAPGGPNSGETSGNKDSAGSVANAKLHLPPGACRLQSDAEGNVVGTCAVPAIEQVGTRLNPFGGNSWNTASPLSNQ